MLWVMIVFALTWDLTGGQMGYNSFGNIVFFGVGMYVCAVTQVGLFYDIGAYTAAAGAINVDYTPRQYFAGLGLGIAAGRGRLRRARGALRPHCVRHARPLLRHRHPRRRRRRGRSWSAAGTTSAPARGIVLAGVPGRPGRHATLFFYYLFCALAASGPSCSCAGSTAPASAWRINAIRDDEDKAEAMGIHTTRYKTMAWCDFRRSSSASSAPSSAT